jgi:hypothetical protein
MVQVRSSLGAAFQFAGATPVQVRLLMKNPPEFTTLGEHLKPIAYISKEIYSIDTSSAVACYLSRIR